MSQGKPYVHITEMASRKKQTRLQDAAILCRMLGVSLVLGIISLMVSMHLRIPHGELHDRG